MFTKTMMLAVCCSSLAFGCVEATSDTQEIIDNLVQAGYPASDIAVIDGTVYVGNDAEVSLQASREMLQPSDSRREQYATNNLVSFFLSRVCINAPGFTGVFATALDLAIENYNQLGLSFQLARAEQGGCGFTIEGVIQPGLVGGVAGFPANLRPFGQITIGGGLSTFDVNTVEHVITHEIGHCFGFRHSDFFNRAISCGSGGDEGDAGVGANHIPNTPTGAVVGGSIMNACFRNFENGEFTGSDITSLDAMY
jgi:hypothetical protein